MFKLTDEQLELLRKQRGTDDVNEAINFSTKHAKILKDNIKRKNKRIMDIGCGLGLKMSMMEDYFDEIHLVDKTNYEFKEKRVSNFGTYDSFTFYNDMDFAVDLVKSRTPAEVFAHDPSNLPDLKFDVITSFYSWGWHFGFDDNDYLEYCREHLNIKGRLFTTIKPIMREHHQKYLLEQKVSMEIITNTDKFILCELKYER
jgi:cyclopropane fatty-acyl-phospholipid synthase-like methyltransferase